MVSYSRTQIGGFSSQELQTNCMIWTVKWSNKRVRRPHCFRCQHGDFRCLTWAHFAPRLGGHVFMCQSVPGPRKPTEGCTSRDVTGVVGTDAFLARIGFNFWVWGMEHSWLCLCYFKESLGFPSNLFLGLANFWPWHPHCIINWLLIVTQLDDAMQHFFPKLTFCKRDLAQTQI